MKLLFYTVFLSFLCIASTLQAETAQLVPHFNKVDRISLFTANGWCLEIKPDGSAAITYGSSGGDGASAPQSSFDFKAVYALLIAHLTEKGNIQSAPAVALRETGLPLGTPTYAVYLDDKGIFNKLMSHALDVSVPMFPKRFAELRQHDPPLQ